VLAVEAADLAAVTAAAGAAGVPAALIGETTTDGVLAVRLAGFGVQWRVAELRHGWESSIEEAMRRPGLET